jgi:hypothetical protein
MDGVAAVRRGLARPRFGGAAGILLSLLVPVTLLLASCQTVPKSIPTTLTESEYFQKGQNAESSGNYLAALDYYNTFKTRFPKDQRRIVEADYEIAFIAYQQGKLAKSKQLFEQIVADYKKPAASSLPRWPLVLANKLILIIDKDMKKK